MTDQTTRGDQQKRSILPVSAKIEFSPPDTHICTKAQLKINFVKSLFLILNVHVLFAKREETHA